MKQPWQRLALAGFHELDSVTRQRERVERHEEKRPVKALPTDDGDSNAESVAFLVSFSTGTAILVSAIPGTPLPLLTTVRSMCVSAEAV